MRFKKLRAISSKALRRNERMTSPSSGRSIGHASAYLRMWVLKGGLSWIPGPIGTFDLITVQCVHSGWDHSLRGRDTELSLKDSLPAAST